MRYIALLLFLVAAGASHFWLSTQRDPQNQTQTKEIEATVKALKGRVLVEGSLIKENDKISSNNKVVVEPASGVTLELEKGLEVELVGPAQFLWWPWLDAFVIQGPVDLIRFAKNRADKIILAADPKYMPSQPSKKAIGSQSGLSNDQIIAGIRAVSAQMERYVEPL